MKIVAIIVVAILLNMHSSYDSPEALVAYILIAIC